MLQETLLFMLGLSLVASRSKPFYRKDYTYVDQYDAFYKVHWDLSGLSWGSAFLACDDEESSIFYPKMKDEWTVVKNLVSAMNVKPNVTEIFVGMHDEYGLGEFITVDGLPTPSPVVAKDATSLDGRSACITMDIDTGNYKIDSCESENVKPFVCKKKVVVEGCPTIDSGYTYVKELNKCFKVNQRKKNWTAAMQTCYMEGAILAVIADSREADIFKKLLPNFNDYFVGFRRLFPNGDLYTVKGLKFDASFYSRWTNSLRDDTIADCGVVYKPGNDYDLYTKTSHCHEPNSFVCEMMPRNYIS